MSKKISGGKGTRKTARGEGVLSGRGMHTRVKTAKGRKLSSTLWLQRQLNDPYVAEAKKMGYPKKKLVLKPRRGSGSKGVIILNSSKKNFEYLLEDKKRFCGTGSITALKKEIKKIKKNISNYFIMPYYNNKTFDVDCLANKGIMKLCIP